MIAEHIQSVTTKWRSVLEEYIKADAERWSRVEASYANEIAVFGDVLEFYPQKEKIFRCFNYFDPERTKVVILGQDPYHGLGQATGLCFGVDKGMTPPPSLRNIMKKLPGDLHDTSLESWAKQGVLMLNASLTVRQGCAGSHMRMWADMTKFVIDWISQHLDGVVFVAWGAFAHSKMEKCLDDPSRNHKLLVSSHPSPLSASRAYKTFPSFKDSNPFEDINSCLEELGKERIQWI